MCIWVWGGIAAAHEVQEKVLDSPGAGVIDGCEPPNVGAGYQTLVLCKNSKHS